MEKLRKKRIISDGIKISSRKIKRTQKTPSLFKKDFSSVMSVQKSSRREKTTKKAVKKSAKKTSHKKNEYSDFSQDKPILSNSHTDQNNQSIFKKIFIFLLNKKKVIKWIMFVFVYALILFFIFSRLEKTKISIEPKTQIISESKSITTYLEPQYNQLGFDIIAINETLSKEVVAGKNVSVQERASGTIKIFNNYSTEPQRLSPQTRFKSVSGKIYKLGKKGVVIPGKSSEKPGEVEAVVYAEKSGPDYNIDITDFTIPGFKEAGLSTKYENIYALSLKSFTGGFNGTRKVIGENQKIQTVKDLESDLKKILVKRLEAEKTDKVILVNDSLHLVFREPKITEKSEKSFVKQDAQLFAVVIEKKQLENYLRKVYLPDVHKDDVSIKDFENINFDYNGKKKINFKNIKKIKITMAIGSTFIWNIDEQLVRESLIGLDKKNVPIILHELDEIESAKIKILPFWQNHISENMEKIKIEIKK